MYMTLKKIIKDENFLDIVKKSKTIPDILKYYGLFEYGNNNTRLKKYLKDNNIDTSHMFVGSSLKGLTKENSEVIKKQAETFQKNYKIGKFKIWCDGKTKNDDTRLKKLSDSISDTICQKVKDGTWHYSFSKVRTHTYNSKNNGIVKVMGSWELHYVKWLDENNINWIQNKNKFYYEFKGLKSGKGYYVPDFYLIDENIYVEIKGYETEKDRAKWKWFPHKLKILKENDLKSYPYNFKLSQKYTKNNLHSRVVSK